jgi:hypothetical protein
LGCTTYTVLIQPAGMGKAFDATPGNPRREIALT